MELLTAKLAAERTCEARAIARIFHLENTKLKIHQAAETGRWCVFIENGIWQLFNSEDYRSFKELGYQIKEGLTCVEISWKP